ncbi:hypothetical protein LZ554_000744 [Drepanopeziza brunnea f. sp. 'monogermtubi']|nr:hypothetical protein LZ554_000744 [Drepanopeziza brunnea f. sp. 'monogermtubi']
MRLRVTVRRHGLPDTSIVWSIDTSSSPTIYQLLEQINGIVPVETDGQWGLEDYAVELKGSNGVNYECLHFQPVASVMKEEDEVIIRPLLTQDLKVRRISGRHQISDDGKRLYDGLALGRPLLRLPAGRPAINIPPRKKRRVTYDEDEDDDEGFAALKETEESESEDNQLLLTEADLEDQDSEDDDDFAPGNDSDAAENEDSDSAEEDDNQQLVLTAASEDDYSEDDGELVPEGENKDEADDDDNDNQLVLHADFDNADSQSDEEGGNISLEEEDSDNEREGSQHGIEEPGTDEVTADVGLASGSDLRQDAADIDDEPALFGISDPETRANIRKLQSAFPSTHIALCKSILSAVGGDMGDAYEVLTRGSRPTKSKSEITETAESHNKLSVEKTRSRRRPKLKHKSPVLDATRDSDSMQDDAEEILDPLVQQYDKQGFPPGSISSGKALAFMAEVARSSPDPHPKSSDAALVKQSKRIKFTDDEDLSTGLTSTPFIDKETQEVELSDDDNDSDDSSDDSSSSSDSSDLYSDDDEEMPDAVNDSSSSDSSMDSSSDSSSEEESPEEESSKTAVRKARSAGVPGKGAARTRSRNMRRRNANHLARYKEKGILPAGTTLAEFSKLKQVNENTSPEEALAALEELRSPAQTTGAGEGSKCASSTGTSTRDVAKEEFELRRQELLASLANGGVEVSIEPAKKPRKSLNPSQRPKLAKNDYSTMPASGAVEVEQAVSSMPDEVETHRPSLIPKAFSNLTPGVTEPSPMEKGDPKSPAGLEAPKDIDTPVPSPKPQPTSAETAPRRAKLDLGAGRRMLFGALGLKTPKTKQDEEKLKKDLMKNVKPLITQKAVEDPKAGINEGLDEDSEAWRDKIIYRAVECVQDDVELSEPPFPFVQRWDSQQRWPKNGKRKNEQRLESQYYNEDSRMSKKQKRNRKGKHTYVEEQEYLEAFYEPSFQEDSFMDTQFDVSAQAQDQNQNVDEEINQQFLNDAQPVAQDLQDSADLPELPGDLSALPDLLDGMAKVGMIVAFKKLQFSAATQWQPLQSDYMTATVTEVLQSGELTLTLALRDRKQIKKRYDARTGQRIFDKFEMPVEDDDDGSVLYLSFEELQEPKIVQNPNASLVETSLEGKANQGIDCDVAMNEPAKVSTASAVVGEKRPQAREGNSIDKSAATLEHEKDATRAQSSLEQLPEASEEELPEIQSSRRYSHEEELPEAQLSHVTETQLNSDASWSFQQDHQPDATKTDQAQPVTASNEEIETEETHVEDPVVEEMENEEIFVDAPVAQKMDLDFADPATPVLRDIDMSEPTDEARQTIGRMMKEAGFRSSVPSSILREIRPDGIQSPGEAALFEKLRDEMISVDDGEENETGKASQVYSPRFNGLGSSPVRKPREISRTPTKPQQAAPASYPEKPPSSSWETIDPEYRSSPPPRRKPFLALNGGDEQSSWVTIENTQADTQAQHSSPPPFERVHRFSVPAPELARSFNHPVQENSGVFTPQPVECAKTMSSPPHDSAKLPVGKAQAYWNQLQPRKRRRSNDSDATSTKSSPKRSPARSLGIDGAEEKEAESSLEYPKLPTNSSFTSQVTDAGRQPDFHFGESIALNDDSIIIPDNDTSTSSNQPEQGSSKFKDGADIATVPPKRSLFTKVVRPPPLPNSSSDEDLPSLKQLSQRAATIKRETTTPVASKKATAADLAYKNAMAEMEDDIADGQTTPKASQSKQRRASTQSSRSQASQSRFIEKPASHPSWSRASDDPASQSRNPVHHASQSRAPARSTSAIPPGSQVIEILSSSDAEPEPEQAAEALDTRPKTFRGFNIDMDDDDIAGSSSGWVQKRSGPTKRAEPRARKASF